MYVRFPGLAIKRANAGFSVIELNIALLLSAVLAGAFYATTKKQISPANDSKTELLQMRVVRRALDELARDVRMSGSNPALIGGDEKSADISFNVNGTDYPFGVNPEPTGSYDIMELFSYRRADTDGDGIPDVAPNSVLGADPDLNVKVSDENILYRLEDRDSDGKFTDLVRVDRFAADGTYSPEASLFSRWIESIAVEFLDASGTAIGTRIVTSTSGSPNSGTWTQEERDSIASVVMTIKYGDERTGKPQIQNRKVRKWVRKS